MGLVIADEPRWGLVYGSDHGALIWAPLWLKEGITFLWNRLACLLRGHDDFGVLGYKHNLVPGYPTCPYCNGRIKIEGRYPTEAEVEANDIITYANFEAKFGSHDQTSA